VRQKNDMVFPVSLSEIAFTLVFILMLLVGFMFLSEREGHDEAKARVAELEQRQFSPRAAAEATAAMAQAQASLTEAMSKAGVASPEQAADLVKEFTNVGEARARQAELRQEVLDLTRKLVALEEVRGRVEQAGRKIDERLTRDEVERALAVVNEITQQTEPPASAGSSPTTKPFDRQQAVERVRQALAATRELRDQAKAKLGVDVAAGQEPQLVRDVVESARLAAAAARDKSSPAALRRENETLRSQVAFYDKRDKLRGLDHPPCWMDADSKIEYIFNVQTTSAGFVVTRGWLAHREGQARASAGFENLMGGDGEALSAGQFSRGAKPFLDYGKAQSPECRHFVYLSSTIPDADRRDVARRLVNSFFYVLETRGPVVP
jgi:hypothetical protein